MTTVWTEILLLAPGLFSTTTGWPSRSANHGAMIRETISAPPPAEMAVAPPPPMPKVFIVFFDWDKDTISPPGMAIVRAAADAYRSGMPVRIQVTGYTDRSGSPGYNQRLSERRAGNVADALAGFGVPRAQMAVSGRGQIWREMLRERCLASGAD